MPPRQRPLAFALMYVAFNLGFPMAAAVGRLISQHSFVWLFLGDPLTTAIYGLIIVFYIPETHPGLTSDTLETVTLPAVLQHISQDTTFLLLAGVTFLSSLVFIQAFSTLPIHMDTTGFGMTTFAITPWLLFPCIVTGQ